jgi:hypothetical protein
MYSPHVCKFFVRAALSATPHFHEDSLPQYNYASADVNQEAAKNGK